MTLSSPPLRFVLFEPTHPGNIGAAARAMKTMGFTDLVLVNPKTAVDGQARARSAGALDVLTSAQIVATLSDAIRDCGLVVGASARRRRLSMPELNPRECGAEVIEGGHSKPVAIVFGTERAGLRNSELDQCNALVYIPSNPEYSSLNLAMAVQVVAYEMRWAQGLDRKPVDVGRPPASATDMELFYEHLERVLLGSGFLNPGNPRKLMRRLRRLFNRARLDENELNIMRGILSALVPGSGRGDDPAVDHQSETES
jgi:tRNA (cytidine32/uridine32-2'-O)-methyltransferase